MNYNSVVLICNSGPEYSPVPEWLRLLLVISCFVQEMDFQLVAIGTVLELMALTQSYTAATSELSLPEKIHGTYSLLIDPVLEPSHLHFLHQHTVFCQVRLFKDLECDGAMVNFQNVNANYVIVIILDCCTYSLAVS